MGDTVEVQPADALRFRFALNKQLLATTTIYNRGDARLAFKIKTTAPKKYVVRPSSGVIEKGTSQAVQVIMQAQKEYPPDFAACKDKFMVQTTALGEDEQIDKDTFSKEVRKDLRESRLRVILEGPPAPPSPVPEANEGDANEAADGAAVGATRTASGTNEAARLRSDLTAASSQIEALKAQSATLTRERDELRRKLDFVELQGGAAQRSKGPASAGEAALKFRASIIHLILVAIIAFLVGHYT